MSTLTERDSPDLTTLADRANEEHRRSKEAMTEALVHARDAGEALNEAKERTPHGSWGDWVRANFQGSPRTARLYQRIARNWSRIEDRQPAADLSVRGADRLLRESEDDGDASDGSDHGVVYGTDCGPPTDPPSPPYDLERHPIRPRLPLSHQTFQGLKLSMYEHGYLRFDPVTMYEGKVLDGWARLRAARQTGRTPLFQEYRGNEPAQFWISMNVHRQHLPPEQRAAVVSQLTEQEDHHAPQR